MIVVTLVKTWTPNRLLVKHLDATIARLAKHWVLVNAVLPPSNPMVVLSDTDFAAFDALPEALAELRKGLRRELVSRRLVVAELRLAKRALKKRLWWFRQVVRGMWSGSVWLYGLPTVPNVSDGEDVFLDPMREASFLWLAMGDLAPVTRDGYGASNFATEVEHVAGLWREFRRAELSVRLARAELAILQTHSAAAVTAYGHAARGRLHPGDPLMGTIPALWPRRKAVESL